MASRYWVGGTASWDGTAGTKWATVSGGAGGAAVPTASDDVFFDAASGAVTVTVAASSVCNNLDFSGFTGTFAGSSALAISGNLTLAAGMTRSYTGAITFNATATGKTITLNGKSTASAVTFDGVGGGWTVQDNWDNGSSGFTVTNGSFDTNGKTITGGTMSSNNSNTRTLTLGASTLNLAGWNLATTTNLTFNANTSTINVTASNLSFIGGGLTYNVVNLSTTGGGSAFNITGANNFASGTWSNTTASVNVSASIQANQTFSGLLTITGFDANTKRLFVKSATTGTPVNISAGSVSLTNVTFMDVTGAGAASWSGTSIGDAGGNSNITFTTPTTRYWVGGTGSWGSTSEWATSTGGASGATVPLPQDTVVFDANSFSAGSQTVTVNVKTMGKDINFTGVTNTPALALTTTGGQMIFGSLTLVAGMTISSHNNQITLAGRGSHTLDSAGLSFGSTSAGTIVQDAPGGTYTLQDALTVSSAGITLTQGTFDANNFNVQALLFSSTNSNTRTITMGSGSWTLTGTGTVWNLATTTNLTLNKDTSSIVINDASATNKTFAGGGKTYNNIQFTGSGTGTFTISGSNTFNNFTVDTPPHTVIFTAGTTQTINGTWSVSGTSGNLITLQSTTTTNFNLSKSSGVVSSDYLSISDSSAAGGASWYAGSHSTDAGGGNTGWLFTDAPVFVSVVTAAFSLPTPSIAISPTVSASVISAIFSLPTPLAEASTSFPASVLSASFSTPAPSFLFDYLVAGSVVQATFSIQSPTIVTGNLVQPLTLGLNLSVQSPITFVTGAKNSSVWTPLSKSAAPSFTNASKHSSSWTSLSKSSAPTYTKQSKNSSTWTAQQK